MIIGAYIKGFSEISLIVVVDGTILKNRYKDGYILQHVWIGMNKFTSDHERLIHMVFLRGLEMYLGNTQNSSFMPDKDVYSGEKHFP